MWRFCFEAVQLTRVHQAILFGVMIMFTPSSYPIEITGPTYHVYLQGDIPCRCGSVASTDEFFTSRTSPTVRTFYCIMEITPGTVHLASVPIPQGAYYLEVKEGDLAANLLCSLLASRDENSKPQ